MNLKKSNNALKICIGDDCESNVARLCRKAKNPISRDILQLLLGPKNQRTITTGAVCVYPAMVPYAKKTIDAIEANLPIASGFYFFFFIEKIYINDFCFSCCWIS